MRTIALKLSGNDKLYFYTAREDQLLNRTSGDRVVVPNKLKEDSSLSLSIGTFEGTADGTVEVAGLKPIVQFLDSTEVRNVQLALLKAEANAPRESA